MKYLIRLRTFASSVLLAMFLVLGSSGIALAAPSANRDEHSMKPPASDFVSGEQAKVPVEPGSRDAQLTQSLGATDLVKTDSEGKAEGFTVAVGAVANVDFLAPLNYCSRNLVYTPVKNTTATTKSLHIRVYNQGTYRDIYTSVAANATVYPASYGINGTYYAYLYVWNGSTYQYDESRTSANTCNVSVTRTVNSGGWVQLKIQNLGTAYASQRSTELAPFPAAGTYTGAHTDSPAPGGAAIYRWFWVGTSPYGIVSDTVGSFNSPYFFTGDL